MAAACLYSIVGWFKSIKGKIPFTKSAVSNCLRLAPFLYFLVIVLELTSPESDYIAIIYMMWICLRLVEIIEVNPGDIIGYSLLAVASFAVVSYKLSAAILCMVTIIPIVLLVRKRQWKNILICAAVSVIVLLPFVLRNIIICGWPVYPVAKFGWIDFPWKLDAQRLTSDAEEIGAWAREAENSAEGALSGIRGWLVSWWDEQYEATQLFIKAVLYALPVMMAAVLGSVIVYVIRFGRKRLNATVADEICVKSESKIEVQRCRLYIFMMVMLVIFMIFYMATAPLIRYCYGPVIMFPLAVAGYLIYIAGLLRGKMKVAALIIESVIAICTIWPQILSANALIKFDYEESVARFSPFEYIVKQIDYPQAEVKEVEYCGYTCYLPVGENNDQCWYYAFPSSPYHECFEQTELMGDDFRSGVVQKE